MVLLGRATCSQVKVVANGCAFNKGKELRVHTWLQQEHSILILLAGLVENSQELGVCDIYLLASSTRNSWGCEDWQWGLRGYILSC